jgi:hypothetical protein
MRLDSSKTPNRSFDQGGSLGSGTVISRQAGKIILDPGADDIIFLTQEGDGLQIKVNDAETVTFDSTESRALEIQGNQTNVIGDDSVTISVPGLVQAPKEDNQNPKSRSAGFVFRGEYSRFLLNQKLDDEE